MGSKINEGNDSANRALGPTLRKAEAEEINHKSQNFVVSNSSMKEVWILNKLL